ncbi:hypothetical protein IAT38_006611 [Cryptococcus sp. DSM 104549]
MEAKLQKLKVTDLKELLAKHHLPQTGKKDDLVKRLMENNITVEGSPAEAAEELVDPDAPSAGTGVPAAAPESTEVPAAPQPAVTEQVTGSDAAVAPPSELPAAASTDSTDAAPAPEPELELTPDQKAMKARAERFGIPFNPNPKSSAATRKSKVESKPAAAATTAAAESRQKAGSIEKGSSPAVDPEVLARRAAKFGVPEKKEAAAPVSKQAAKPEEVDPELAAKIAIEEEKKRKRAEKFGPKPVAAAPVAETNGTNGVAEPDAKRAKV